LLVLFHSRQKVFRRNVPLPNIGTPSVTASQPAVLTLSILPLKAINANAVALLTTTKNAVAQSNGIIATAVFAGVEISAANSGSDGMPCSAGNNSRGQLAEKAK